MIINHLVPYKLVIVLSQENMVKRVVNSCQEGTKWLKRGVFYSEKGANILTQRCP